MICVLHGQNRPYCIYQWNTSHSRSKTNVFTMANQVHATVTNNNGNLTSYNMSDRITTNTSLGLIFTDNHTSLDWRNLDWLKYTRYSISMCEAALSLFLNGAVIASFVKFPSMRGSTNWLICNKCIADFIFSLLEIFHIVDFEWLNDSTSQLGLCVGPMTVTAVVLCVHILTWCLLAIDRLIAVYRPLVYRRRATLKFMVNVTVVIWIYCCLITVIPSLMDTLLDPQVDPTSCSNRADVVVKHTFVPYFFIQYALILVVIGSFDICTVVLLRKATSDVRARNDHANSSVKQVVLKRERKLTNATLVATFIVVILYLPAILSKLVAKFHTSIVFIMVSQYLHLLYSVTTWMTPLMFIVKIPEYKRAFRMLMPCCGYELAHNARSISRTSMTSALEYTVRPSGRMSTTSELTYNVRRSPRISTASELAYNARSNGRMSTSSEPAYNPRSNARLSTTSELSYNVRRSPRISTASELARSNGRMSTTSELSYNVRQSPRMSTASELARSNGRMSTTSELSYNVSRSPRISIASELAYNGRSNGRMSTSSELDYNPRSNDRISTTSELTSNARPNGRISTTCMECTESDI